MRQPDGYFDPAKGTMFSVECLAVSKQMFPDTFIAYYGGHTTPVYLDPGPTDDELRERWLPIIMAGWRAGDKSNTSANGMAGDATRDVEALLTEHRKRQRERAEGGDDG